MMKFLRKEGKSEGQRGEPWLAESPTTFRKAPTVRPAVRPQTTTPSEISETIWYIFFPFRGLPSDGNCVTLIHAKTFGEHLNHCGERTTIIWLRRFSKQLHWPQPAKRCDQSEGLWEEWWSADTKPRPIAMIQ